MLQRQYNQKIKVVKKLTKREQEKEYKKKRKVAKTIIKSKEFNEEQKKLILEILGVEV